MVYAISMDWSEELSHDEWENEGRRVIENKCTHKHPEDKTESWMRYAGYCEKCGFGEDSAMPMMNFAYPLDNKPTDAQIYEVVKRTNCSVMYNRESDEYVLVLCGGGMDLSQDIAFAYSLASFRIPFDLCMEVCEQKELSIRGEDWELLKKAMQKSLKGYMLGAEETLKRWS